MARTYRRDARGRFAGGGFSGQSGGRGARLKAKGSRDGGGAKMRGARTGGTVAKPRGLKPGSIKPKAAPTRKARKPDLSQSAFEARAKKTERRARAAERAVQGADRGYASRSTRKMFRTADALRSAADSYSSIARRSRNNEFSAADLFKSYTRSSKRTTAPKLSRSEKAARTRAANAEKRFRENVRRMEADRRR